MKITDTYGNMIQGVSRQPDSHKFAGQWRELINCNNDPVRGLSSRPPFKLIRKLSATYDDKALIKFIELDDDNKFFFVFSKAAIDIYDLAGVKQSFVWGGNERAYYSYNLNNPKEELVLSSPIPNEGEVESYQIYISNKNLLPLMKGSATVNNPELNITWLRFDTIPQNTEIEIEFDIASVKSSYKFTTFSGNYTYDDKNKILPAGADAKGVQYDGSWHANMLANLDTIPANKTEYLGGADGQLAPILPKGLTHIADAAGGWLRISDAKVKIVKGSGFIELFNSRSIKGVNDIPPVAKEGDLIRVTEGKGKNEKVGYFKAHSVYKGQTMGQVSWKETTSWSVNTNEIDASTMPHKLVWRKEAQSAGALTGIQLTHPTPKGWRLEAVNWAERKTGDEESNPVPYFIDNKRPIKCIGTFQGRLFMSSDSVVTFSATDDHDNLWLDSAFYRLDTDPFYLYVDAHKSTEILKAIPADGDLLFFSRNNQFIMAGNDIQTYKTATITNASSYEYTGVADPIVAGDNVVFGTSQGDHAGLRELFTANYANIKKSRSLTTHVNDYILGEISNLSASGMLNALLVQTPEKPESLYIFEWTYKGEERAQEAWSTWTLGEEYQFAYAHFSKRGIYAIIKNADNEYLLTELVWGASVSTPDLPFEVQLDLLQRASLTYDASKHRTKVGIEGGLKDPWFIEGKGSDSLGFKAEYIRENNEFYVSGDYSGVELWAGIPIHKVADLPIPYVKTNTGNPYHIDRLQLMALYWRFTQVGDVELEIQTARGGELHLEDVNDANKRLLKFNNRRINRLDNRPSNLPVSAGYWKTPVRRKTKDLFVTLRSDSIVPFSLESIEYILNYKKR